VSLALDVGGGGIVVLAVVLLLRPSCSRWPARASMLLWVVASAAVLCRAWFCGCHFPASCPPPRSSAGPAFLRWSPSDCSWSIRHLGTALPDGDRQPLVSASVLVRHDATIIPRAQKCRANRNPQPIMPTTNPTLKDLPRNGFPPPVGRPDRRWTAGLICSGRRLCPLASH